MKPTYRHGARIVCHAPGIQCDGCAHYYGRADECFYARNARRARLDAINSLDLQWYAVPPYRNEGWQIVDERGEHVAVFENRGDCEHVVELHNQHRSKV